MQLDFRQILNGLRKRWWLAVIVALTAGVVAFLYSNSQPKIYQSQTTMIAETVPLDNGVVEAIKKTLTTYTQDLGSKASWRSALDNSLVRNVSVDGLAGQIKIQARPDDTSIVMTVDNTDPAMAQLVAGVIAQDFVERQNAANQQASAAGSRVVWLISQEAALPDKPYQPRPLLYTTAAALFGLILGLLLAIVLELLDTTLKNPPEVQQYVGLNTLGVIPKA